MRIDLHLHSTASDGVLTPLQLVEAALEARLDVIALTDHDTVAGVGPAIESVGGRPLEVIPGIEVSSHWQGREIHVLGYHLDLTSPSLLSHAERAGRLREDRIEGMRTRLEESGIEVTMEEILEAAGPERHSLGRPHLARALVARGYVTSTTEAFDRLIGDDHPAFIPTLLLTPEEAIQLIQSAGGVAVWAHPPADLVDPLLPLLRRAGLDGIEVYRPRLVGERLLRLEQIARSAGLLMTGGSDWHGPGGSLQLGEFWVTRDEVGPLLERGRG